MRRSSYGSGTIFQRGAIWYVAHWVNGRQVQRVYLSRAESMSDYEQMVREAEQAVGPVKDPELKRIAFEKFWLLC